MNSFVFDVMEVKEESVNLAFSLLLVIVWMAM